MLPLENNCRSSLRQVVYADFRLVHHSVCKRILLTKSRVTFKLRGQEDVAKPKKRAKPGKKTPLTPHNTLDTATAPGLAENGKTEQQGPG